VVILVFDFSSSFTSSLPPLLHLSSSQHLTLSTLPYLHLPVLTLLVLLVVGYCSASCSSCSCTCSSSCSSCSSFSVMAVFMNAVVLSMRSDGYTFDEYEVPIQVHVAGMFGPSLFTGFLISKWGVKVVIFVGFLLLEFSCILFFFTQTSSDPSTTFFSSPAFSSSFSTSFYSSSFFFSPWAGLSPSSYSTLSVFSSSSSSSASSSSFTSSSLPPSTSSVSYAIYILGMGLVGIAWNFSFIGGTTLLSLNYRNSEKFKVQAFNDFFVFSGNTIATLLTGLTYGALGWRGITIILLICTTLNLVLIVYNHLTTTSPPSSGSFFSSCCSRLRR
jgi:MFS family permease